MPDHAKQIERSRSILTNLLRQVTPEARDTHLSRLADAYQGVIDGVLATIDTSPPVSVRLPKARVAKLTDASHVHSATCEHVHEAVTGAEAATVPGAIRCVLASERDGLSPRAIIAGVILLRPGTSDALVHGSLHQMKKRGELIRIGANGKIGYALNPTFGNLTMDPAPAAASGGGETH